jgi:hypothetical protein
MVLEKTIEFRMNFCLILINKLGWVNPRLWLCVEVLDFLTGYESYLRKPGISVSSRRYKPTGKHRHSLR